MGQALARSLRIAGSLWHQRGGIFCGVTCYGYPSYNSRRSLCAEACGFDKSPCHWARCNDRYRRYLYCAPWICAITAAFAKHWPVSRDRYLARCPWPFADRVDQSETGFASTCDRALNVWTGGCHRPGGGRTDCRCDRFGWVSGRLARSLWAAPDPRAVLYRTRQLTI